MRTLAGMASSLRNIPLHESAARAAATPRSETTPPRPAAGVRWLQVPDAGLPHQLHRCAALLPALLRRHRLQPDRAGHYATRLQARTPPADAPGAAVQGVIDLLQARVLADLGINGRHVRLLRHRSRLPGGHAAAAATAVQDVDCRLARTVRIGPTEVAVLLETHIADAGGHLLLQVEDAFVVRELEVAYAVQAETDDLLRRAVSRMRRREREIDASAVGVRQHHLFVAPGAGRWLRPRRLPVAPMRLRELVARELATCGTRQAGLEIVFVGRARPGQTLRLLLQGDAYELVDERGRLVAYGRA